jgi:hypothetical protein
MSKWRVALRWAAIAAIAHGLVVAVATLVYCLLIGKQASRAAGGFLHTVDWPVFWAIERAVNGAAAMLLEDGYRMPPSWPLDQIWTTVLVVGSSHIVIGGALYALLAAVLALFVHDRRQQRELAAPASSS